MLDKSLSLENTKRNADWLKSFCTMRSVDVFYWDWEDNITLSDKSAPCDDSKAEFEYILKEEIKPIEELIIEDEDEI